MRLQRALPVGLAATALAAGAAASARADSASLYRGPVPRPGPDLLYQTPATGTAAQLTNDPAGVWKAPPILVSGASAYRQGEFIYQDWLYDDTGAHGQSDPNDPRSSGNTFSAPYGTYTYPSDQASYAGNLADLVEFRVKALADATALRVTLNTLTEKAIAGDLVAFSVAIGDSPVAGVATPMPHGANVKSQGHYFLTVHGTTADLQDNAGNTITPAPTVTIDRLRRQIEVRIAHAAWNPGSARVRFAIGVGLWNRAGGAAGSGAYLIPGQGSSATSPGGAGTLPSPPAFFNVGFRFQHDPGSGDEEPMPAITNPSEPFSAPKWWRDYRQAGALTAGDISNLSAQVDFAKLIAGANDDMTGKPQGVPATGAMDRIMASHTETEQGADYAVKCGVADACLGELRGRLQPYAIYIPARTAAGGRYGLTLLLHSLAANYNQFLGSHNQSQFGDRGSIVITPAGRGPDGWYYDQAGADTFEVWADVAQRFPLEPAFTDLAGYSMGGYGTYKFATQFPDLFAKAQPTVGPPGLGIWSPPAAPTGGESTLTDHQLAGLRNVPILIWDGANDELVPLPGPQQQANDIDALDYRYEFDVFGGADHFALAVNDQYDPPAAFLGADRVDYNPPHVSYTYNPSMDFAKDGTAAGHAYWVSGVTLAGASENNGRATIDVRSEGFGVGDAPASATTRGGGSLTGGTYPALAYTSQAKTWDKAPPAPVRDQLDITATNVRTVTIDSARARITCDVTLNVKAAGPLTINVPGCGSVTGTKTLKLVRKRAACFSRRSLTINVDRPKGTRIAAIKVVIGTRRVSSVRGRNLRSGRIDLRGLPRGTFKVTITVEYLTGGRRRIVTYTRKFHTCVKGRRHVQHARGRQVRG